MSPSKRKLLEARCFRIELILESECQASHDENAKRTDDRTGACANSAWNREQDLAAKSTAYLIESLGISEFGERPVAGEVVTTRRNQILEEKSQEGSPIPPARPRRRELVSVASTLVTLPDTAIKTPHKTPHSRTTYQM